MLCTLSQEIEMNRTIVIRSCVGLATLVLCVVVYGVYKMNSNSNAAQAALQQKLDEATAALNNRPTPPPAPPQHDVSGGASFKNATSQVSLNNSVDGLFKAIDDGRSVNVKMNQGVETGETRIHQAIWASSGDEGLKIAGGEANRMTSEGKAMEIEASAKVIEAQAKAGLVKREPLPPVVVEVKGHVDVGGNVAIDGDVDVSGEIRHTGAINHDGTIHHTGKVHHDGSMIHAGLILHDGTVTHEGSVKVTGEINGKMTGTVTLDGATKKVVWDPCSRQWYEYPGK